MGNIKKNCDFGKRFWERFKNDEVAVNCQTEDEANEFLKMCRERGMDFKEDRSEGGSCWNDYKTETCYNCNWGNNLTYCRKQYYENDLEMEVIAFRDLCIVPSTTVWERFKNNEVAINCQTEDEANEFLKMCRERGMDFKEGSSENDNFWNHYKTKTCYDCECEDKLTYCDTEYYEDAVNIEVIAFRKLVENNIIEDSTFTKANLRSGMKAILKDGSEYIVLLGCHGKTQKAQDILINYINQSYILLSYYNESLKFFNRFGAEVKELDIVKIYYYDYKPIITHINLIDTSTEVLLWQRNADRKVKFEEAMILYTEGKFIKDKDGIYYMKNCDRHCAECVANIPDDIVNDIVDECNLGFLNYLTQDKIKGDWWAV
jgi:hypothetical protein